MRNLLSLVTEQKYWVAIRLTHVSVMSTAISTIIVNKPIRLLNLRLSVLSLF